jgi:hypothetical protein
LPIARKKLSPAVRKSWTRSTGKARMETKPKGMEKPLHRKKNMMAISTMQPTRKSMKEEMRQDRGKTSAGK